MKNKVQIFKNTLSHMLDYKKKLCFNRIKFNPPNSVYWSHVGSNYFGVAIDDGGGHRVARVEVGIEGHWVLRYENRRKREGIGIFMTETTEKEVINLESYFEDPLKPADEEANLFCLLFANLSGFLVEVSNLIREEEVNCGE